MRAAGRDVLGLVLTIGVVMVAAIVWAPHAARAALPPAAPGTVDALAPAALAPAGLDIPSDRLCTFDTTVLPEVSGLAQSRRHPDVVWATNDSLNGPYLYALDTTDCRIRATLHLVGADSRDQEALAVGTDAAGRDVIWIGDLGDNDAHWPYVRIYKVLEPAVLADADVAVTTYRFTYPRRPVNAEALIAAPDREQLWVITKVRRGPGAVYELPSPMGSGPEPMTAHRVGAARSLITDAAMSPDGARYVVRDYFSAEVFLGNPPGAAQARFRLPFQVGGESVTWTPDGTSLLVAAEGSGALFRVSVPRVALGVDTGLASRLPRIAGFDIYPYVRLSVMALVTLVALVVLIRRGSRRAHAGRRG